MGLSLTKLLDLINTDNNPTVALTENNVNVSAPVVDSGANYNTRVTLSAIPGRSFTGSIDVKYKRINLSALNGLQFSSQDFTDKASFFAHLNTLKGTWLEEADLQPFTLPDPEGMDEGEYADIVLIAKSTSLSWLGTTTLSYLKPTTTKVSVDVPDFVALPAPTLTVDALTAGGVGVAANATVYVANPGLTMLVTPSTPFFSTDLLRIEARQFSGVSWSDWANHSSSFAIQGNGKGLVTDNVYASASISAGLSANTQFEFRVRVQREAQTVYSPAFGFTAKKNP